MANFNVTMQNVATGFPYTGQWYNLTDNTTLTVTKVNDPITITPGNSESMETKRLLWQ